MATKLLDTHVTNSDSDSANRSPSAHGSEARDHGKGDEGESMLLGAGDPAQLVESYAASEELLNNFLRLHPMLSMEATDAKVLSAVCAPATGRTELMTHVLPVVPKSYEDSMLRPARIDNGERSCALGRECLCAFIARLRFGPTTDKGFTGVEFLLPSEREAWRAGGGLPERTGKCLLCLRYFTTYCHVLAASDPTFYNALVRGTVRAQTHANATLRLNTDTDTGLAQLLADDSPVPSHACAVNCRDGYASSALLDVADSFANTRMGRETTMGAALWQPLVRFSSSTLRYQRDPDTGEPWIVQVGVGHDVLTHSETLGAGDASTLEPSNGRPPSRTGLSMAAMNGDPM